MNKKILIGCTIAILILLTISLTPVIGSKNLDCMTKNSGFLPDEIPEFASGEFIVKFRENVEIYLSFSPNGFLNTGETSIDLLNMRYSVISAEKIFKSNQTPSLLNVYKFVFADAAADMFSIIEEYNRDPNVVYVEPNYVYHSYVIPNDLEFTEQWALHNTGQDGGTPDADIDAPEAWDIETGSPDVVIAIVDTGVDYNHEDLADNIWYDNQGNPGYDFVNDDNDPSDDYGHGTHCAGIAAAVTNNGEGIAGVCWNCKIMPIKSLNNKGGGYNDDLAEGILYAADNDADIISMSWGGNSYSNLIRDALDHANSKGVVLVASAGNGFNHIKSYPAGYDNVIAVAATDNNDNKADFSNYGYWIDVAAPGVHIYSSLPRPYIYGWMDGTSMACPHVAGLAALLLSKNECINLPGMVKTLIVNTADPISSDEYIGGGRINAYQALLREPAIAILDGFSDWSDVKGIIDINGWAWSDAFKNYTIAYGRGGEPDSWTEIKYSTSLVQDDVLAVLDTTGLNEGLYTIRLTVVCNDGVYTDKKRIVVNNEKNTIHVDADNTGGPWEGTTENPFMYIRDGVDDAGKDDIVYVYSGTYYESTLFIEKTISLTGEDQDTTIIDGNGHGDVVFIIADNVELSGFTIKHSAAFRCGIYVSSSSNTIVNKNIIKDTYFGVYSFRSFYTIISENIITTNNNGYGIRISQSSNNTISENTITNNLESISLNSASYNNFYGNNITNNGNGFSITKEDPAYQDSIKNNIYKNNITNNNGLGIKIFGNYSGTYDNNIYHNNFINNNQNAYDEYDNTWYNTDLKEGNYWDDHKGFDPDGDGIANNPYKIPDEDHDPFNNNKDKYPLMGPYPEPISYNKDSQSNQQSRTQQSSNRLFILILERFIEFFQLIKQIIGI